VFNLGFGELVVILVVALVFLGPKMLPEIATGLGKVIREIRKATADIKQDIELDDMIRKPLQELRDAATLPPEELKRRDEIKAAQRKAAEEEARRKELAAKAKTEEAKAAEEATRKQPEAVAEVERQHKPSEVLAKAAAAMPMPSLGKDAVSTGGTMIASPPPSEDIQTLEPIPDLQTPAPTLKTPPPRLPPPPPLPRPSQPGMKAVPPSDATVIDLHAQVNAATAVAMNETLAARSARSSKPASPSHPAQPAQPSTTRKKD
jgi:Tat protein translocase TatB subunit